jgi:glycine cleavage system T protein (aminomethyltransferase)
VEAGRQEGIVPVGLGTRDTLRLEAGYPLFGHEYLPDRPILAVPQATFGVSLDKSCPDFVGRRALVAQMHDLQKGGADKLPKRIMAVAALAPAMILGGSKVMVRDRCVGELTSGNIVPAWNSNCSQPTNGVYKRAIGLAYLDREIKPGQQIEISCRSHGVAGVVVT